MVKVSSITMKLSEISERKLPSAILFAQKKLYHEQSLMRYHVTMWKKVYKDVREVMHLNLTRQALYLWLFEPKFKKLCEK